VSTSKTRSTSETDTAVRTESGGYARDLDGDGELEYAGANPLYLGVVGAGIALVVASLMTWATSYGTDVAVSGMERAGVITMIIGAALVILGLLGWAYNPWSDPEALWSLILSLVGFGIVVWQMIDVSGGIRTPDIGAGLWLAAITLASSITLSAVIAFAPEP